MADLIKLKTGTIAKIDKDNPNKPALDKGSVYFAVDTDNHIGKILYDAPVGTNGVDRIVMSTQAEYADEAGKATGITGIYPVKGTQTTTTARWTGILGGNITELFDGLTIAYYLPRTSASNVTLTLTFEKTGENTAAIPVYWTGQRRADTHYEPGSTIILTYWSARSISIDGTATTSARWVRADYDSTNTYQLRANYGGFKPTTDLYRFQLLLTKNETDLVPINAVNNSTATTKTLTTEEFNPFKPIYWWNTIIAVNANRVIGDWTNLYSQVLADFRYSFNIGQTLTANKAVYLVAIPQNNGMAKLDTNPIAQDLPVTEDNKIYIYLGQAQDGYQVELVPVHPIYYYKNGRIIAYTGEPEATTTSSGLMSASDKSKLAGITEGATNTTITATAPINASANTGAVTLTHSTSGPSTTGNTSKGDTANKTPGFGETFKAISATVDKFGHTTALAEHTVTIPATEASTSTKGLMTTSQVSKLAGIDEGAEVNQNTFAKIKVGSTTIEADAKQDTLELAGSNVTLTPDATNDKVTIGITKTNVTSALGYTPPTTNTTYDEATTTVAGLMSASDKAKLDGIEEGAQVNTVTGVKGNSESTYRTGNVNITKANIGLGNVENKSSATIRGEITSSNVTTALGYTPATQAVASTSANGLMSATDKSNFDSGIGIAGNTIAIGGSITADTLRTSLGLSNAMHFIGIATVAITDGSTTDPTITGYDFGTNGVNAKPGDVVIDKDSAYEFVWTGIKWERLGPDGSYALSNHTHSNATTSAAGFMSKDDKSKLNGIAEGATNTTISATGPIAASASTGAVTISHNTSGVTANTYGVTATTALTPGFGSTFSVPGFTVNATGHITAAGAHNVTIPSTAASTSVAGLMSAADKGKLEGIQEGATAVSFSRNLTSGTKIGTITINGTATDLYSTNNTWTAFKGATASAAGTAGYINAVPAAGQTGLYFGSDGAWHGNATTSTAGLMTAEDKSKLAGIAEGAKPGTVTSVATGAGLTGGTITGSGTIKANLRSETKLTNDSAAATETAGRVYPVALDKTGYLAVNVPWVNTTYSAATTSTAGLMSASDKSKLNGVAEGATNTTITGSSPIIASASTGAVTISHATSGPSTSGNTSKGDTSNQTPTWGGTFKVTSGTVDKFGHTTAFAEHTVTIPSALASTSAAGLMSKDDKSKLNGIADGATANTGTVTKITAGTGLNTSADQADSATKGSITTTGTLYLTTSGVTANSYGPSANATPAHSGTFSVPYITVDKYGRVTAASTKTITLPADSNTDTKVANTLSTTTKYYVTGTSSATTNTGTQYFDTGIYATTTAGELNAKQYKVDEAVTLQYNSTTKSLDFIFA